MRRANWALEGTVWKGERKVLVGQGGGTSGERGDMGRRKIRVLMGRRVGKGGERVGRQGEEGNEEGALMGQGGDEDEEAV